MAKDNAVVYLKSATRSSAWLPLSLAGSLLITGCSWMADMAQQAHLRGYDRDIQNASRAIDSAHNDADRAKAYSQRGSAYSEKARYSRAFKLIQTAEYERLFSLAMKDHDQAIALNAASSELYYDRGKAYYDRAMLNMTDHQDYKPWFDHAAADFELTSAKDPRNFMAFDMLGLTYEQNAEWDKAIDTYTREMALNHLGKARLAGVWCDRGQHDQTDLKFEAAATDYEHSIAADPTPQTDGCDCDPYNSLLGLYAFQTHEYDKAWNLVQKAKTSHQQIAPELVDELKKASGRSN
ncbi:MAG TPA: hypothetical protein VGF82_11750 [Terracidiphilus sp.]|jgi:tetratricopeptide (TPR) repeat protein